MADTTVAPVALAVNTVSADILTTAEGGTAVSAGNVAVIDAKGDTGRLLISLYNASGGATATVQAGDNPPSLKAGLGATSALTIPAADCVLLVIDPGRFAQDDGKIRITIGSNTVVVGAHLLPREM